MQIDVERFGPWEQALKGYLHLSENLQRALEREVRKMAVLLVREIKKGIVKGAPGGQTLAANKPSTIAKKGSSKPLIDDGLLLSSIVEVIKGDRAFVGLLYTARNADGSSVANIGAVMEFGATITMPNGTVVVIPPRPFLSPVMKLHVDTYLNNIKKAIADVFAQIGH